MTDPTAAGPPAVRMTGQLPPLPPLRALTLGAMGRLLAFLGDRKPAPATLDEAKNRWQKLPDQKTAAATLRLGELKKLSEVVLKACEAGGVTGSEPAAVVRTATLAMMRLHFWLDLVRSRVPEFPQTGVVAPSADDEDAANRRLRTLELLLRAAIAESSATREALHDRLRRLRPGEVDKWLRAADGGDVLTGLEFQPLIQLFVDEDEYPAHYAKFYETTSFLRLYPDKRVTLRNFLEDARELRNRVAHHKPITQNQIALLALYYEEVTQPLAEAHATGKTVVDPNSMLDDGASIPTWVAELQKRASRTEEDSVFLRGATIRIESKLGSLFRLAGVLVVVAVVASAGIGATLYMTGNIQLGVSRIETTVSQVKKETSQDPQKELANLGVPWTADRYVEAVVSGNVREAKLFEAAGMALNNPAYTICRLIQAKGPNIPAMLDLAIRAGLDVTQPQQNCQNLRDTAEPLLTGAIRAANGPAVEDLLARGVRVTPAMFQAFDEMNVQDFTTGRPAAFTSKYRALLTSRLANQPSLLPAEELRARGLSPDAAGAVAAVERHDIEALRLYAALKVELPQDSIFEKLCAVVGSDDVDLGGLLDVLQPMGFDLNRPSRACSFSAQPPYDLLTRVVMARDDAQTRVLLDHGAKPTAQAVEALQLPFGRMDGQLPDPAYPAKWQPILQRGVRGPVAGGGAGSRR